MLCMSAFGLSSWWSVTRKGRISSQTIKDMSRKVKEDWILFKSWLTWGGGGSPCNKWKCNLDGMILKGVYSTHVKYKDCQQLLAQKYVSLGDYHSFLKTATLPIFSLLQLSSSVAWNVLKEDKQQSNVFFFWLKGVKTQLSCNSLSHTHPEHASFVSFCDVENWWPKRGA